LENYFHGRFIKTCLEKGLLSVSENWGQTLKSSGLENQQNHVPMKMASFGDNTTPIFRKAKQFSPKVVSLLKVLTWQATHPGPYKT
jgi:hypothetical protein